MGFLLISINPKVSQNQPEMSRNLLGPKYIIRAAGEKGYSIKRWVAGKSLFCK